MHTTMTMRTGMKAVTIIKTPESEHQTQFIHRYSSMTNIGSVRTFSRPPTPGPRILHHQYSDPFMRNTHVPENEIDRDELFDRTPFRNTHQQHSPWQQRSLSRETSPAGGVCGSARHPFSHRSEHHKLVDRYDGRNAGGRRHSGSRSGPRGQNRGGTTREEYGGKLAAEGPQDLNLVDIEIGERNADEQRGGGILHALSAPPIRSSSLSHRNEPGSGENERQPANSGKGPNRRSRPRLLEDELRESRILGAGDELMVIDRHAPRLHGDYDWFDSEGMRVRVREI